VFIEEFNARSGQRVETVPESVWRRLGAYHWPGNVRELRNLVERCVLLADDPVFPERWLSLGEVTPPAHAENGSTDEETDRLCLPLDGSLSLDAIERRILSDALARNGSNVSRTARMLGTTRERLRYRVHKHGLKTLD
jgi:DNA-binding NtrC family response regulator